MVDGTRFRGKVFCVSCEGFKVTTGPHEAHKVCAIYAYVPRLGVAYMAVWRTGFFREVDKVLGWVNSGPESVCALGRCGAVCVAERETPFPVLDTQQRVCPGGCKTSRREKKRRTRSTPHRYE